MVASEGGPLTAHLEPPNLDLAFDGNPETKPDHLTSPELSPDGRWVAVVGHTKEYDPVTREKTFRHVSTLYAYDLAPGRHVKLASGARSLPQPGGEPISVTGEPVAMGTATWTPDGRRLLYLVPEPGGGPARWTIRSIDAAGGSPSEILVEGVQSFDLGHR